jgi:hypothetical protein
MVYCYTPCFKQGTLNQALSYVLYSKIQVLLTLVLHQDVGNQCSLLTTDVISTYIIDVYFRYVHQYVDHQCSLLLKANTIKTSLIRTPTVNAVKVLRLTQVSMNILLIRTVEDNMISTFIENPYRQ